MVHFIGMGPLTIFSPYHHETLWQGFFTLQQISLDWTGLGLLGLFCGGAREWGITRFSAMEYQRNLFA